MWDFITSSEFPETAEYIEEIYSINLDDLEPSQEGSTKFRFRRYTDSKGKVQPIPFLTMSRNIDFKIECKPGLPFKPGDEIRFNMNPESQFTITKVETAIDSRNKEDYINTNTSWPGLAEKTIILIVTLQ